MKLKSKSQCANIMTILMSLNENIGFLIVIQLVVKHSVVHNLHVIGLDFARIIKLYILE